MKPLLHMLIIIVLLQIGTTSNAYAEDYILGAGDTISVTVFNETDMSLPSVRIPKSGSITFPYIGDINVSGLTLEELKKKLIKKLKDGYLKKPQLVISIDTYRSFFVNGEVKAPGGYPYVEDLTVRKAIAIAGGLTDRASLSKMSLLKEGGGKASKIANSLDLKMNPGDVLTIGESLF